MRDRHDRIVDALAGPGWLAVENFFAPDLTEALIDDLSHARARVGLKAASVGRGGHQPQPDIRTDDTLWLDGTTPAQREYLAVMENLRLSLNRALYLGLFDYESHYAVYAPGGFYRKHRDSLHGARNRIVSCVTYLTPGWADADQGELVLYDPDDEDREMARILPRDGTLALFMSESVPHEVLPPQRERCSIAGWFRCNPSSGGRVDPAG